MNYTVDLLVIGGGINGTAVACDAAGRGLSVLLCEKDDLASHTSSASTKLIHGGLRYLEQYDFKLVRHALKEREILLRKAPHLVTPLAFVLPHASHLRPAWVVRMGLWLYDHLSRRTLLPSSRAVNFKRDPVGEPLQSTFEKGFCYYDCFTDDARLVVLNAIAAKEKGATISTRTSCVELKRVDNVWNAVLLTEDQEKIQVQAKAVVNAAGAWVSKVLTGMAGFEAPYELQLVKGSHLIVPKFYEGTHAYILQHTDRRVIFVIPYFEHYTLIGTTDINFSGDPDQITMSKEEENYLLDIVNSYFKADIHSEQIVWSYAGVRTLCGGKKDNPAKLSRDYHLHLEGDKHQAPMISVYGGKITTHRVLAESVMKLLKSYFPKMKASWTAKMPLPGGDLGMATFAEFYQRLKKIYAWVPDTLLQRLSHSYGSRIHLILQGCQSMDDLGPCYQGDLYEKEVYYLREEEWAKTKEDIIWRRTKVGLRAHTNKD